MSYTFPVIFIPFTFYLNSTHTHRIAICTIHENDKYMFADCIIIIYSWCKGEILEFSFWSLWLDGILSLNMLLLVHVLASRPSSCAQKKNSMNTACISCGDMIEKFVSKLIIIHGSTQKTALNNNIFQPSNKTKTSQWQYYWIWQLMWHRIGVSNDCNEWIRRPQRPWWGVSVTLPRRLTPGHTQICNRQWNFSSYNPDMVIEIFLDRHACTHTYHLNHQ